MSVDTFTIRITYFLPRLHVTPSGQIIAMVHANDPLPKIEQIPTEDARRNIAFLRH